MKCLRLDWPCSTGRPSLYFCALANNAMLRVSWTYKLSAHLRGNQRTVLAVSLLEAVRRCSWNFFRLEARGHSSCGFPNCPTSSADEDGCTQVAYFRAIKKAEAPRD